MNTTIKSLITAGGTITAAALFYLVRHFPDATRRRTQPQPVVVDVPLVETPPVEPPFPVATPPRPRPIPRPAIEQEGLTAKTLLDALALMRPLIQRHPTLPIVECVLLEPGQMTITDLESRLTIQMPALAVSPVCVHAMQLQKALRGIKGSVTLAAENGWVQITSGGVTLSLTTFAAEEYPAHVGSMIGSERSRGFVLPLRVGDDVSNSYLLFWMSYDASAAHSYGLTSVRVVCRNTLRMALSGKSAQLV